MNLDPASLLYVRSASRRDDLNLSSSAGEGVRLRRDEVSAWVPIEARVGRGENDDAHKKRIGRTPATVDPASAELPKNRLNLFDDARALAATTSGFGFLLAALDRRLHVVPAALQLAKNAFRRHLALQVLDCTLDPAIANGDLERLAGDGFGGGDLRHGHNVLSGGGDYGRGPADAQAHAAQEITI